MTTRGVVVGAALVRDGALLAARRTSRAGPASGAGRWELPGGKVEPGELPEPALVREIHEELGCEIAVESWLDGEQPVDAGLALRVAICRLVAGEPRAGADHDELRWLGPDRLDDVDWLEPDRPFVAGCRTWLLGSQS